MNPSRRTLLSTLGLALPFGLGRASRANDRPGGSAAIRFRPFEEAVREAFAATRRDAPGDLACRRIEVGDSEQVRAGVQGCYNDRPFAGFPAGSLRIVRAGSAPGPALQGARLYISTVDVVLVRADPSTAPSRPLDFASLPPAPVFA